MMRHGLSKVHARELEMMEIGGHLCSLGPARNAAANSARSQRVPGDVRSA